jgi:hypothetical protein
MVRGAMVLMRGVRIGNLYKLLGNVDLTRCNNIVVPKFDSTQLNSNITNLIVPCRVDSTMLWHQRMGHIGKKDFELCITKVWLKVFLIVI